MNNYISNNKLYRRNAITYILMLLFMISFVFSLFQVKSTTSEEENKQKVDIYVFTQEGCKNCASMKEYLQDLNLSYVETHFYNSTSPQYNELYKKARELYVDNGVSFGFPFTIIGGKYYIGYNNIITKSIRTDIKEFSDLQNGENKLYHNVIQMLQNGEEVSKDYLIKNTYKIPLLGTIDAKKANLFFVSVILGFLDGINPCGMWILLFILSLLIPTNNKKKIWILGGTYILTSGIFYFALMMAWINLIDLFENTTILLIVTGVFALIFGFYNLYKYIKSKIKKDEGCDVQSAEQKRKLSKKLKKVITNEKIWLAVVGIAGITLTVNLVEVACSAGWPALFSNVLIASQISKGSRLFYTIIYVLFFLIDDIIVFVIALCSLKIKAISNTLSKYAHLIGGILMIIFGILMIFFPDFVTTYL